eukprot:1944634-Rhodomonas_salina.1
MREEPGKMPAGKDGWGSAEQASDLRALLSECEAISASIHKCVTARVLSSPRDHHADVTEFRTRSTVGVMVSGLVIDGMVVGGPAFLSHKLQRGDEIKKVDGVEVTEDDWD